VTCLSICGNSHTVEAHRMTAPWSTSSTSSQLQFDSTALSTVTATAGQVTGWLYWPITTTVQNWLSGAQPNYGLLMKRDTEPLGVGGIGSPSRTYAAENTLQPQLQVTYTSDAIDLQRPTTLHSNGAELHWSQFTGPSGAPFQQYAIYRSMTPNFTPSPATLLTTITDPTVTSYRDTTAAPGGAFSYAVLANTTKSNEVTVTLPADGRATKTVYSPAPSFMLRAALDDVGADDNFEQPWTKRVGEDRFEVCCIPFFAYDLALGDVVRADAASGYVIQAVEQRSRNGVVQVAVKRASLYRNVAGCSVFQLETGA
jgi:hypothetical protein